VREPEDLGRPAPVRAIQAHPFLEVAVAEFASFFDVGFWIQGVMIPRSSIRLFLGGFSVSIVG
jgi:hypothetical protein